MLALALRVGSHGTYALSHEIGTLVDESAVELHEASACLELANGILGAVDASYADDGDATAKLASKGGEYLGGLVVEGLA